jgi:hypothetical protein
LASIHWIATVKAPETASAKRRLDGVADCDGDPLDRGEEDPVGPADAGLHRGGRFAGDAGGGADRGEEFASIAGGFADRRCGGDAEEPEGGGEAFTSFGAG